MMREAGTLARVSDLYVTRIVDGLLDELLVSFPAISLVGPRAAGKTTTAVRRGDTVLRLDRPEVRQSVAASPDAMLAGLRPPVILDEWQEVPELLGAVKRSVDADPAPGRYILTGPGVWNLDFSAIKNFPIRERQSLQLRIETFNILNHAAWASPNMNWGGNSATPAPSFGQIRDIVTAAGFVRGTAYDMRQLQFALKYIF